MDPVSDFAYEGEVLHSLLAIDDPEYESVPIDVAGYDLDSLMDWPHLIDWSLFCYLLPYSLTMVS